MKTETPINNQLLESILSKKFDSPKVDSFFKRTGGAISEVLELKCSNPKKDLIIKIYELIDWEMGTELIANKIMKENKRIPLPTILIADDSKAILDFNYIVMEKLQGDVLAKVSDGLDKQVLYSIFKQVGRLLREIHSITFDYYGYIPIDKRFPNNKEFMIHEFESKLIEFEKLGDDKTTMKKLKTILENSQGLFIDDGTAHLCHGDYHENNILVAKNGHGLKVSGVIDFGMIKAADPLFDISRFYYYGIKGNKVKEDGFWEGYGKLPEGERVKLTLYELYQILDGYVWAVSTKDEQKILTRKKDLSAALTRLQTRI